MGLEELPRFRKKRCAGFSDSKEESCEKIKISGFGKFEVKQKKERIGRNPQTGERITISARRVLNFSPSQVLKAMLNGKSDFEGGDEFDD